MLGMREQEQSETIYTNFQYSYKSGQFGEEKNIFMVFIGKWLVNEIDFNYGQYQQADKQ